MDLTLGSEDQAFQDEVRAFIADNLSDDMVEANRLTSGIFAEIEIRAIDATEQRLMSEMSQGQNPGAASSMVKTLGSEVNQRVSELGIEAIAHYGFPHQPEARVPGGNVEPIGPDHAVAAMARYLNTRAHSIYAGSNEIQRNIMAKLVLGL